MALNVTTIARPYAKALYDLAADADQLSLWAEILHVLKLAVEDSTMQIALCDPRVTAMNRAELLVEVCGDDLFEEARNFVQLLALNGRLLLLPEIAKRFTELSSQYNNVTFVKVVAVNDLSAEQQQMLKNKLKQRLDSEVELAISVDKSLLGGIKLHIGDHVLDGSIGGKLQRIKRFLLE